jgi:hypothetical protein
MESETFSVLGRYSFRMPSLVVLVAIKGGYDTGLGGLQKRLKCACLCYNSLHVTSLADCDVQHQWAQLYEYQLQD